MTSRLIKILLALIAAGLFACGGNSKASQDKATIDLNAVDSITIKRHKDINHTVVHRPIKLTKSQVKIIVDKWNNASSTGLCIFLPVFEMAVYLKGDQTRQFRINARGIKENKDWCYDLDDREFIQKLLLRANQ